jgi:hypothetical protein
VNDRIAVEIIDRGHEAILELLLGCDADVAQDRAGEFGKETLDEIEPGAVLGSESELSPPGPSAGIYSTIAPVSVGALRDNGVERGLPASSA